MKKSTVLCVLFFIIQSATVYCQPKFMNLCTIKKNTWLFDVEQCNDGGYCFLTQTSDSVYGTLIDYALTKTDSFGNIESIKRLNVPNFSGWLAFRKMKNDFLIGCQTIFNKTNTSDNILLTKIDQNTNILWSKMYSTMGVGIWNIYPAKNNGCILIGFTNYGHAGGDEDIVAFNIDSLGNMKWGMNYGTKMSENMYSAVQLNDGGFIISGGTNFRDSMNSDILLTRIDSMGNIKWNKIVYGSGSEQGTSVNIDSSGTRVFVSGSTNSFGAGMDDFFLFECDINGNIVWSKTYGNSTENYAGSMLWNSGVMLSNNKFLLKGYTNTLNNAWDILLIETDLHGNVNWSNTYGGPGNEFMSNVRETSQHGLIMCASTQSYNGSLIISMDSLGEVGCNQYSFLTTVNNAPFKVIDTTLLQFSIGATIDTSFTFTNLTGISKSVCTPNNINELNNGLSFDIYPNPATTSLTVRTSQSNPVQISLRNMLGQTVSSSEPSVSSAYSIDVGDLPKALYIVEVRNIVTGAVGRQKIIVE